MNTAINSIGVGGGYAGYGPAQGAQAEAAVRKVQSANVADEVTLSSNEKVGKHLCEMFGFPMLDELGKMGSPGMSRVVRIQDLRAAYERMFDEFTKRLESLLDSGGIDRSRPARLQTDAAGNIVVTNDHPDQEAIQRLFLENPDLAKQFRGLSGLASLLAAAEQHAEFAAEYEKNPYSAVGGYSQLFANHRPAFELLLGPEEITATLRDD